MSNRRLTIVVSMAGLATAGVILPYRSDLGWIDPVTGSMKHQTQCFLVPLKAVVEQSALERWIIHHEGGYSNKWQFLHETCSGVIFGRAFACGHAPAIHSLRVGEWNDEFVRGATDAEIAEFVHIMRAGTPAEREHAVEAACDQAIRRHKAKWGLSFELLPRPLKQPLSV